jgi:hypothetical protein
MSILFSPLGGNDAEEDGRDGVQPFTYFNVDFTVSPAT